MGALVCYRFVLGKGKLDAIAGGSSCRVDEGRRAFPNRNPLWKVSEEC